MLIVASKLKLEPGEAHVKPALSGVAHVVKKVGDRTYEAWVDSKLLREDCEGVPYLQCFP